MTGGNPPDGDVRVEGDTPGELLLEYPLGWPGGCKIGPPKGLVGCEDLMTSADLWCLNEGFWLT